MAVGKLSGDNPLDGTNIFTLMRFYEADDSSGTGAVQLTALYDDSNSLITGGNVPIDTSGADLMDTGRTSATYTDLNPSKYYACTWYDETNIAETGYSRWVKGGWDRWDLLFTDWLNDSDETIFSATKRELFKNNTLNSLRGDPPLLHEVVDTSLSTDTAKVLYSIPYGFVELYEVGYSTNGSPDDADYIELSDWQIDVNKLRLQDSPSSSDKKLRLRGGKYFTRPDDVPSRYDELALLYMMAQAFESMADDYPSFEKFAQLQKGSKVSFAQLRSEARSRYAQFDKKKVDLVTLAPSVDKMRGQS